MPAYNLEPYISEAIQSVLTQTYKNFELIIINDGSTDHTQDVINKFSDSRIKAIRQDNMGVSVARNVGIAHAAGEYICFLDGDDRYEPKFLELISHIAGDVIYSGFYVFGDKGKDNPAKRTYFDGDILPKLITYPEPYHFDSFVVSKKLLERTGIQFTPGCLCMSDTEFQRKCLCWSNAQCIRQELTGYRHNRPGSISSERNYYERNVSRLNVLKRLLNYFEENYTSPHRKEVLEAYKDEINYMTYRVILYAIREHRFLEANQLLDNHAVELKKKYKTFKNLLKWELISTRNKFIWRLL